MDNSKEKTFLQKLKEKRAIIIAGTLLLSVIVSFTLLISGSQDCEVVDIHEGVKKTCDCKGLLVTVKSTQISGEKKTVCLGLITKKANY